MPVLLDLPLHDTGCLKMPLNASSHDLGEETKGSESYRVSSCFPGFGASSKAARGNQGTSRKSLRLDAVRSPPRNPISDLENSVKSGTRPQRSFAKRRPNQIARSDPESQNSKTDEQAKVEKVAFQATNLPTIEPLLDKLAEQPHSEILAADSARNTSIPSSTEAGSSNQQQLNLLRDSSKPPFRPRRSTHSSSEGEESSTARCTNERVRASEFQLELKARWILNQGMTFRDDLEREKFFITYAERPNLWRRVTVTCSYRHPLEGSLEAYLKSLHFQTDKISYIYHEIRESLPSIEFYDTVTNLRLETMGQRLHIDVGEDVNEIIEYPLRTAIEHIDCPMIPESALHFESHLSGFVYKVNVNGVTLVKKEIPEVDMVDEFLYEINALHALSKARDVIDFRGVVVDDSGSYIKGLLISYAEGGALVDVMTDHKDKIQEWHRREKWAEQIVRGLSDIHEHGFVQGDLTLSNIVIDCNDDAKVIDLNRRGCPVGYEPPEIKRCIDSGQKISMFIGVKSDLYQLGMVLWGLAALNEAPQREDDLEDLHESAPEISDYFSHLVQSCLSEAPEQRKSAKELLSQFPPTTWNNSLPSDAPVTKNLPGSRPKTKLSPKRDETSGSFSDEMDATNEPGSKPSRSLQQQDSGFDEAFETLEDFNLDSIHERASLQNAPDASGFEEAGGDTFLAGMGAEFQASSL